MTEDRIIVGTFSGHLLDLCHLKPDDVKLVDIAHHLALTCRFGGACRCHYSVAEHSVRMSRLDYMFPHPAALLMHDSAEAYIGDLTPGVKQAFDIRPFEYIILNIIAARFGLRSKWLCHPDLKVVDETMALTEIRDLLNWKSAQYLVTDAKSLPITTGIINPWHWRTAEKMFLARAAELNIEEIEGE